MANFKKLFHEMSLQQTDCQMNENTFQTKYISKTQKHFENRKFLSIFAPAKAKFWKFG
jgi:hypothetical protein